jgi:Fic family protein
MKVSPPPSQNEIIRELPGDRLVELFEADAPEPAGEYVHWDKLRHLKPPGGLSHREWWFVIKAGRRRSMVKTPLTDPGGEPFSYSTPDTVLRRLHSVDRRCAGTIAMPEVVTDDEQARQHYLVNSLMEEAIRSSQLEGASTSRRVAKDLLRSERAPEDRSERMIVNNYRALEFMRGVGDRLTPEIVLELQRILTEGTLEDSDSAGRVQTSDDQRVAVHAADGEVVHTPPPADQLPRRLQMLCDFANQPDDSEPFVHPVLRSILLHFWLAYDHPFEDGNGRTARALFSWHMRTRGYWLVEYLSISRILRNAPAQYGRAFLLTETDDRDLTYFIDYQLGILDRAVEELHAYLNRKVEERRAVERRLRGASVFNRRQLALLSHALKHLDASYTYIGHAHSHGVTHETARNDLTALVEHGLLARTRVRGRHIFTAPPDLPGRLERVS